MQAGVSGMVRARVGYGKAVFAMASFDLFDPDAAPKGVATHLKTPFLEDGRLDEASYERTARHSVEAGSTLIIVGQRGTETLALSEAERYRSLGIALDVCADRVPVVSTATGASIADVAATAHRMEQMGADAISVLAPAWIKSSEDVITGLKAVGDKLTVPMFARCSDWGSTMTVDQLARLPSEIPNVRYLKEECHPCPRRVKALLETPGGKQYIRIMVGTSPPGPLLGYVAGARLFMCAADVLEPYIAVFDLLEAGDIDEARRIHNLVGALGYFKNYIGGQFNNKMIMHWRGLFDSGRKASPTWESGLRDLTPEEADELTVLLEPLMPYYDAYPPVRPSDGA